MEFINNNKGLIVIGGLVAVTIGFLATGNPNQTDTPTTTDKQADSKVEEAKKAENATPANDTKEQQGKAPAKEATKDTHEHHNDAESHDDHKHGESAVEHKKDAYMYVAQAGDSYSVLARKAVQTYGIENNVSLSQAQIVAAETFITRSAHAPALAIGQKVHLAKNTVKMYAEKAKKLSKSEVMAWKTYVPYVNFDTRKNGEA